MATTFDLSPETLSVVTCAFRSIVDELSEHGSPDAVEHVCLSAALFFERAGAPITGYFAAMALRYRDLATKEAQAFAELTGNLR